MSSQQSTFHTFKIAFLVCLVCSVVVSTAAVGLRQLQQQNKALELQKNILLAANLLDSTQASASEIRQGFVAVSSRIVDLRSGTFAQGMDADSYDQRRAAKTPDQSQSLSAAEDIASIKRRAHYAKVYIVEQDGQLQTLILPVHGYGLWSTLYGFVALKADLNTLVGMGFYEHAETPGLGGEVDNPNWKAQWMGKQVYDDEGVLQLQVLKGKVNPNNPQQQRHAIDGLSGASLTSRGVSNMMRYWFGQQGFLPFLQNMKAGEV